MIFVRDIRLPLSAPQGQAVESALKTLRLSHRLVEGAEISKISVDARHGSPRLVYTVALRFDMPAFMLKLVSAVVVVAAISIPYLKEQYPLFRRRTEHRMGRRRTGC